MRRDVAMQGLDGSNPLAFLAALGVVVALGSEGREPELSWREEGRWIPVVRDEELSPTDVVSILDRDRVGCGDDPMLAFEYDAGVRDLKPSPEQCRNLLTALAARCAAGGPGSAPSRRCVDWAASLLTDIGLDNNGRIKPTALHFTAGNQKFLEMARTLQAEVNADHLREALFGPWRYVCELPVMGWDATSSREYAFRATKPADDKKRGIPGADWLALRGLTCLPVFPEGSGPPRTTGCRGTWKTGSFHWPLWTTWLGQTVIRTALALPDLHRSDPELDRERQAVGIALVHRCRIKRSDQGGYGSFAPPSVI